jgi:hypothetical protein
MENKSSVFVNKEGFIEITYAEHVTVENQAVMQEELYKLAFKQDEVGKPLKFLTDLSHVVNYDTQAQNLATRGISGLEIVKVAAFGARPEVEKVHASLYSRSKKPDLIRYFTTREEVIVWLME